MVFDAILELKKRFITVNSIQTEIIIKPINKNKYI